MSIIVSTLLVWISGPAPRLGRPIPVPRPQYEIAFERGDAAACLFQVFVIELFGIALGGFDLYLLPATPRGFAFTQFSSERNGDDCEGDFSPGG